MHSPPSLPITCLPVNEALPQRPAPAAQVAHALPGQEGRPGEETLQVLVRQPELRPHALPHRLLACAPPAQPGMAKDLGVYNSEGSTRVQVPILHRPNIWETQKA